MIYVHVKHHLNDEGFQYFDGWFLRVTAFMSKSDGYVSLTHEKYPEEGMIHITLTFTEEEKLNAWVIQPRHDDLVNELDPYRTQAVWYAARTSAKVIDWKILGYDKIDAVNCPAAKR